MHVFDRYNYEGIRDSLRGPMKVNFINNNNNQRTTKLYSNKKIAHTHQYLCVCILYNYICVCVCSGVNLVWGVGG